MCPSPSTRRGGALSPRRLPRLEGALVSGASAQSESHRRAQQKAVVWRDLFAMARDTPRRMCVSRHGNKCAGNGVRPVHPTGRSRPPQAPVATSSPTAAARPHHRSSTSRASTLRRRPRVKNAATNTGTPSVSPQWCRRKWRRETQTPPPPSRPTQTQGRVEHRQAASSSAPSSSIDRTTSNAQRNVHPPSRVQCTGQGCDPSLVAAGGELLAEGLPHAVHFLGVLFQHVFSH